MSAKYACITQHRGSFDVTLMCRVLDVSPSGFYATQQRAPSARAGRDEQLTVQIRAAHQQSRRRPRRFVRTTDSAHGDPIAPNTLARQFAVEAIGACDRVWTGDITYVPTREGWLYLAVILDLASRRVVGWAVRATLERELVLAALAMALTHRQPAQGVLHHSDRGSHGLRHGEATP